MLSFTPLLLRWWLRWSQKKFLGDKKLFEHSEKMLFESFFHESDLSNTFSRIWQSRDESKYSEVSHNKTFRILAALDSLRKFCSKTTEQKEQHFAKSFVEFIRNQRGELNLQTALLKSNIDFLYIFTNIAISTNLGVLDSPRQGVAKKNLDSSATFTLR